MKLRSAIAGALEPGVGLREWLPETFEDWAYPASRRGPESSKSGGASCKLKRAKGVRGATQTACRLLNVDNAELARIIRTHHGSDVVRDEYEKRKSTRVSERRFVRGATGAPAPSGRRPGVKAAERPPRVLPAVEPQAEPQAEPCGDADQSVVGFAARLGGAPEAPPGAVAPSAEEYPSRVADILLGSPSPAVAPRFRLCALGMSLWELERVSPRVAPAQWQGESSEMGRRPFDFRPSPAWHALSGAFAPLGRLAGSALRRVLRFCGGALGMVDLPPSSTGDVDPSVATVTLGTSLGLEAWEPKPASADYVAGLPDSVVRSPCTNTPWVAESAPHVVEPFGVL